MGIISRFFGLDAEPVGRRAFLRNLVTAAPAAVAAAAAIDLSFVSEVKAAARDELRKMDEMVEGDLGLENGEIKRIIVGSPKQIFDTARVWRSVANEAGAWADYVVGLTGVARSRALDQCTRLARLVDSDLRTAKIAKDTKIDVQLPRVVRTWTNGRGEKHCEIGLGLHQETLFDGSKQHVVKFSDKAPRLVDASGKVFKSAGQEDGWRDVTARQKAAPDNVGWHRPRTWDRPKVTKEFGIETVVYASLGPQDPPPKF